MARPSMTEKLFTGTLDTNKKCLLDKIEVFSGAMVFCRSRKCKLHFIRVTGRLHLFVGDQLTSNSTSTIGRVVCESSQTIQLFSYLLDKNRSITFSGAMVFFRSENCNTFHSGHLTASSFRRSSVENSTSSIGRVVCESSPSIQLFSYLLDKNRSITFSGAMVFYRSRKCNTFQKGHPTASSFRRRPSDEYFNFTDKRKLSVDHLTLLSFSHTCWIKIEVRCRPVTLRT